VLRNEPGNRRERPAGPAPAGTAGSQPAGEPADPLLEDLGELREGVRELARTELAVLSWRARRGWLRLLRSAFVLLFTCTAGVTAAVLGVRGASGAVRALAGGSAWAGDLAAGVLVFAGLLGYLGLRRRAVDGRPLRPDGGRVEGARRGPAATAAPAPNGQG